MPLSSHTFLFLFFLFLMCFSSSSTVSAGKCNKDDKKVLLIIKKELNDPYVLIAWTSEFACCDWPGVTCEERTSRVTSLAVLQANTSTTIPPAVADLPFLTSLTFHKNPGLTGPIPQAIGTMTQLTFLRLDWNGLSGPVPDFLAHLTKLEYLNLAFNQFSGSIPPSLASLHKLAYIRIDRNRLTGSIPESLARSPATYLLLGHNNLTGQIPTSFATNNYEILDLSRNKLSGDASHLFGALKPLQRLDLSRNQLEFDMTNVKLPKNIVALDLNHNKIYGALPPEIGKIEWQLLNVSYNRLCGPIPIGERVQQFDEYSFFHNKCLCGSPLLPCK